MMVILLTALVALAVLLSAPADPAARLRELLARRGDPSSARSGLGGRRHVGRRNGGHAGRSIRGQSATDPDPEQEKLWAISAAENCAHLLRVGMTPQAVMATLSRQNPRLQPISRAIALGEDPGRAIATRSDTLPVPAAEVFAGMAAVWTVSERSGAPAADMILRYARAQRDALDADRERRIAMAGPKATVRVLSWLPLIGVGLGLIIGVQPLELVSGLPGQLSIGLGLGLYVAGRLWMTSMMKQAQR